MRGKTFAQEVLPYLLSAKWKDSMIHKRRGRAFDEWGPAKLLRGEIDWPTSSNKSVEMRIFAISLLYPACQ